ncbi:MAG: cold shock domain-containing protein, partial [Candidatus Dadabacteria bacterium]|nr:cold shock domain-containing protein [Candidatus Dadabacteria bacterium]
YALAPGRARRCASEWRRGLLKSFIMGEMPAISPGKFVNAMMKGDYEAYRKDDMPELLPVFQVDTQTRQSPLLNLRILDLLQVTKNTGRSIDDRHMELQSIISYFESMGCPEIAVEKALIGLLEAKLIEAFDASVQELSPNQKMSITHSGQAHLRLATHDHIFFEQMAITTAIVDEESAIKLREIYLSKSQLPQRMEKVRRTFVTYLLEEDAHHLSVPSDLPKYESQRDLIDRLRKFSISQSDSPQKEILCEKVHAIVDWFDTARGFGFVEVDEVEGRIFLHAKTLRSCGIDQVSDGDDLLCDVGRNDRGIHVARIHDIQTDRSSVSKAHCKIVRLFLDRGYGFVQVNGGPDNAFFHLSAISPDDQDRLDVGVIIEAEIGPDRKGRGLQVKRVLSIHSSQFSDRSGIHHSVAISDSK